MINSSELIINGIANFDIVSIMETCRACYSNDISKKIIKKGEKVLDKGGWCEVCYNDKIFPIFKKLE